MERERGRGWEGEKEGERGDIFTCDNGMKQIMGHWDLYLQYIFLSVIPVDIVQPHKTSTYPGVGVFCVPQSLDPPLNQETAYQVANLQPLTVVGGLLTILFIAPHCFTTKVQQLVGYAVGEMVVSSESDGDGEDSGDRWRPSTGDCFEVVTAWVHPK